MIRVAFCCFFVASGTTTKTTTTTATTTTTTTSALLPLLLLLLLLQLPLLLLLLLLLVLFPARSPMTPRHVSHVPPACPRENINYPTGLFSAKRVTCPATALSHIFATCVTYPPEMNYLRTVLTTYVLPTYLPIYLFVCKFAYPALNFSGSRNLFFAQLPHKSS